MAFISFSTLRKKNQNLSQGLSEGQSINGRISGINWGLAGNTLRTTDPTTPGANQVFMVGIQHQTSLVPAGCVSEDFQFLGVLATGQSGG